MVTLPSIIDLHCPLDMMGTCALKKSRLEQPSTSNDVTALFCAQAQVVLGVHSVGRVAVDLRHFHSKRAMCWEP